MGRRHTGAVVWDGQAYRALPDGHTGAEEAYLEPGAIEQLPRVAYVPSGDEPEVVEHPAVLEEARWHQEGSPGMTYDGPVDYPREATTEHVETGHYEFMEAST
jgi:hypothetical protein